VKGRLIVLVVQQVGIAAIAANTEKGGLAEAVVEPVGHL
jgi:hypothetical protein